MRVREVERHHFGGASSASNSDWFITQFAPVAIG